MRIQRKSTWLGSALLLGGLMTAAPGWAADTTAGAGSGAASARQAAAPTDQEVVMELHHDNLNEIHMGKMAQQRGTARAVKDYGAQLVKDHQAADRKLLDYARGAKMDPARLNAPYDAANHGGMQAPEVAQAKGAEFDAQFAAHMVAGHQATIDRAQAAQKMVKDPQLKALLTDMMPTLQAHLKTAQSLAPAVATTPETTPDRGAAGRRPVRK